MNFIKESLIAKITKEVTKRQRSYTHFSFFFLNDPIKIGDMVINRVSNWCIYEEEQILPKKFTLLDGKTLLTILDRIMEEEFYFFKIVDGKKYKIKMKKDDTFGSKYSKQYN
jgi:hypothetical protein